MILKNKLKKALALFIILASMTGLKLNAQSLQISFDIAGTNGGYHISCHGASDGSIESNGQVVLLHILTYGAMLQQPLILVEFRLGRIY